MSASLSSQTESRLKKTFHFIASLEHDAVCVKRDVHDADLMMHLAGSACAPAAIKLCRERLGALNIISQVEQWAAV